MERRWALELLEKAKRAIRLDLSRDGVQRYIASTTSHIPIVVYYQQALHVVVTSPLSVVAFPMTTEAMHFFRDVVGPSGAQLLRGTELVVSEPDSEEGSGSETSKWGQVIMCHVWVELELN